jgi:hypothetical protein
MLDYLLSRQPYRRWIIRLYDYLPIRLQAKILVRLFPEGIEVRFTDKFKEHYRCL